VLVPNFQRFWRNFPAGPLADPTGVPTLAKPS